MPYTNSQIAETSRSVASRLHVALDQMDLYALTYLARIAEKEHVGRDFRKALEVASGGDKEIADRIKEALDHSKIPFDDLLDNFPAVDLAALDAYLEHGPVPQSVFDGESSTPDGVARLALAILDVQPGEKVIDYGCGQGNFLESAAAQCPDAELVGVEINPVTLATAKIRSKVRRSSISFVHGDMFHFYEENVAGARIDKAFSNYPWGLRAAMFERTSAYIEKVLDGKGRYGRPLSSDWVFNRLLVDSLKDAGTAVAIMSNGACHNGGDKPARRHFVENGFIKAVVALPKGVFAPCAMIPSSLVILCPGGAEGIRFVDATDLGTYDRRGCTLTDDDVDAVLRRLGSDSEKSAFKSIDEVAARDFDLSATRYLWKEIDIPNSVELGSVAKIKRGAGVRASDLDALVCDKDTGISYLSLGNISDGCIDAELPNLSELDPKLEKYCIHDGDVLISKNGTPFKVAVAEVPQGRKVLANGNLYALSVDAEKIDPHYLAAFLMSPAGGELMIRKAVGTSILGLPVRALAAMKVPLEGAERQKVVAAAYIAKTDEIKTLKLDLARARREISDLFDETI